MLQLPFGFHSTASDVLKGVDLRGKTMIVTGGASGIGIETSSALAAAGASVVIAARRTQAAEEVAADLRMRSVNPSIQVRQLDLADVHSVSRFVDEWEGPIHALVNNAGHHGVAVPATLFPRMGDAVRDQLPGAFCLDLRPPPIPRHSQRRARRVREFERKPFRPGVLGRSRTSTSSPAIALLKSHIQFKIFAYSKYTRGERKMSLYIRDNEVDALAVKVQRLTKAPNKTEAVRRALQNELARAQEAVPLKDRIKMIQDDVKARMGPNKPDFDMKKYTDEMWGV
ncbi:hypothetical protein J2X72_004351 [Phyllobacterium sp. 1468]|nr:hypothetical protein [Phyllobacterium sp. 1468]